MTESALHAGVVCMLLAVLIVPVVLAEYRRTRARRGNRNAARFKPPPKPITQTKARLRLVVNKNDMDRELAALLAQNSRKPPEEYQ